MALYEWLDRIEARPGLYLEKPGFVGLKNFIAGYDTALIANHIVEEEQPPFFRFGAFVLSQFGRGGEKARMGSIELSDVNWQTAIADAAGNDEEAFRVFFQLLRQYRQQK